MSQSVCQPLTFTLNRMPATTVPQLLRDLATIDPTSPRLTFYDDTPGTTCGERVELSGRVLVNWVSKAANLLQDEFDAGPGTRVALDLPAHWRAAYWALAAWATGSTVVTPVTAPGTADDLNAADIVITADALTAAAADRSVLVALPALARSHDDAALAGEALLEPRDLPGFGDRFDPWATPNATDIALHRRPSRADGPPGGITFGELLAYPDGNLANRRFALDATEVADFVLTVTRLLAGGGSVVALRGAMGEQSARLAQEGVTTDLRDG